MTVIELLIRQLQGSNGPLHARADDLGPEEWAGLRVLPSTNLLGLTVWHLARSRDWAVQTAIRGVPKVVCRPEWSSRPSSRGLGMDAGWAAEEADVVACSIRASDVCAYNALASEVCHVESAAVPLEAGARG